MKAIITVTFLAQLASSYAFSIHQSPVAQPNKISTLTTSALHLSNHDTDNNKNHLRTAGKLILQRSDTLQSAGFYEDDQEYPPLVAGAKTNIALFLAALGYKWYRSIFINKLAIWERQPQWNTVITSKEDEEKANLEAMTCNNCGSTIFIAKGRKWFQMPKDYTCYCCGASGPDAFTNTREELLEEIDDDYFDYEKPLDFVTAAERRQLMKQAGGDEEKANALLTQSQAGGEDKEADSDGSKTKGAKKKKKKKGKKKKKKKMDDAVAADAETDASSESKASSKKSNDDDDLDVLGMD